MTLKFCCPVCQGLLADEGKTLKCPFGHCYDKAKSGYVNLLLANKKNSKAPGDNKQMVRSRTEFLNKGYYYPLADAVAKAALKYGKNGMTLLDAGCGEGYYTKIAADELCELSPEIYGVDISKEALAVAAKRLSAGRFAAGSIFHLPFEDDACDMIMTLFAPWCGEEMIRALAPDGILLLVIPGKKHLWELKSAVYDEPYENPVKDFELEGFLLLEEIKIDERINLESPADIRNLFLMTPYSYKTSIEGERRLEALKSLETEISFHLLVYKKK